MSSELGDDRLKLALEAWKTAIEVQQHFNTIEMQIRSIAVTVLTAAIGAAALAFSQVQDTLRETANVEAPVPDVGAVTVLGVRLSEADMILLGGLIAWLAFYFMDRWWYHRLLHGAVSHAAHIEDLVAKDERVGDVLSLSKRIGKASAFKFLGIMEVRTNTKIDLFYGAVAIVLILIMAFAF